MDNDRQLTPGVPVVIVLGATATGKTALAIRIAQHFGGEVISADSRYFYRGMDIGTAKPTVAERAGVPHHLIDLRDPHEPYSVATFLEDAYAAIEDVAARGGLPVVAGGTPQYLRALLEGWRIPQVAPDERLRAALDREPVTALFDRVRAVDPLSAERIGPHNKRRLVRALEVYAATGRPLSAQATADPPPYRLYIVGLRLDRESLYARIDARVRAMVAAGWLDEVRALHMAGVTPDLPSMSAHGYREMLDVVLGQTTLDDAVARTCFMIHKYVRHQSTWFRRFRDVHWFDSANQMLEETVVAGVDAFLHPEG
jgi:tRNA dimethylallyltransferase